jgi:hypothetical protein
MSCPQNPKPAKLVIGILLSEKQLLQAVADDLQNVYGNIDMVSLWMDFEYTDYYSREMGKPLFRRMFVFTQLVEQMELSKIKQYTNMLEHKYAVSDRRRVNIDPGYLLYERFVLATGKNYSHRIYIGDGIYADLTLIFQKGAYQSLPWTYPDYQDEGMKAFLALVRQKYSIDVKKQEQFLME